MSATQHLITSRALRSVAHVTSARPAVARRRAIAYVARMLLRSSLIMIAIVLASPIAFAQEADSVSVEKGWTAREVAQDDAFTPIMFRSEDRGRAVASAAATYNSAADATTFDLHGEVHVWGPARLVLSVQSVFENARPGIGAAVQFLKEGKHGVSSSAYLQYK